MQNIVIQNNVAQNNVAQNKKKKNDAEFIMPTKENYSILLFNNYTIKHLKEIVAHYKIKLLGATVKAEIISKIYNYFKLYDSAVILQKAWRRYLFKQYNKIRGPARFNRSLCVNDTDFFSMDSVKEIPYVQFYSFKDSDNMIYGFDIMSIYNLFDKANNEKIKNPYNRNPLNRQVKKNMLKIIWLSKMFKETINLSMHDDEENTPIQTFENRVIALFHDIDILGNYTNYNWFMSLTQPYLLKFIIELNDIWSYRAHLTNDIKREICPNYVDLFSMTYIVDIRSVGAQILREIALAIMEKLVRNGINHDSRCLGTNFVLCALTMVSADAAEALPWLYQSVI